MKKFISAILTVALLLAFIPGMTLTASASKSQYGDAWIWDDSLVAVWGNESDFEYGILQIGREETNDVCIGAYRYGLSGGNIVIPSTIGGYNVRVIGSFSTLYNKTTTIKSVTIPDSVVLIGRMAFYNQYGLESVTIPNSVTYIGDHAFSGCPSLTRVTIPNSVTYIGDYAFASGWLESVTIPNSVTYLGDGAFDGCDFTSITIPDSLTEIRARTFSSCVNLTSVTIPNSVTSIGELAFSNCRSLKSVTIPDSVTSIGDSAFIWCESLTSITIPKSVTSIGANIIGLWDDKGADIPNLNVTISCYPNSTAHIYAKENGYKFKLLDDIPPEPKPEPKPEPIPNSLTNFAKVQPYDNRFTDLNWSGTWVSKAYEYGIIAGTGPNTFGSNDNMTTQNALVIASKIHAIYTTGSDTALTTGAIYPTTYINYALEHGIIDGRFDGRYGQDATRAELAYMWSRILPASELQGINTYSPVSDVSANHEHYDAVKLFYEAGIVSGSDTGLFNPDSPASRGDCAVMFVRLVSPSDRSGAK